MIRDLQGLLQYEKEQEMRYQRTRERSQSSLNSTFCTQCPTASIISNSQDVSHFEMRNIHLFTSFHRSHVCFRIVFLLIVVVFRNALLTVEGMAVQSNMITMQQNLGTSALRQVQDLAQIVALANKSALQDTTGKAKPIENSSSNVKLLSGLVGFSRKRKWVELRRLRKRQKLNQKVVSTALESLERDSTSSLCDCNRKLNFT